MTDLPECLLRSDEFTYRQEILFELERGATLRIDSRRFSANELVGTYKIRVRIANKAYQDDPGPQLHDSVRDMTILVENLAKIADG